LNLGFTCPVRINIYKNSLFQLIYRKTCVLKTLTNYSKYPGVEPIAHTGDRFKSRTSLC